MRVGGFGSDGPPATGPASRAGETDLGPRPEEATPLRGGQGLIESLARGPTSWYTTGHESLCGDGRSTGIALVPPRGGHPQGPAPARREGRVDRVDDGRLGPVADDDAGAIRVDLSAGRHGEACTLLLNRAVKLLPLSSGWPDL